MWRWIPVSVNFIFCYFIELIVWLTSSESRSTTDQIGAACEVYEQLYVVFQNSV